MQVSFLNFSNRDGNFEKWETTSYTFDFLTNVKSNEKLTSNTKDKRKYEQ